MTQLHKQHPSEITWQLFPFSLSTPAKSVGLSAEEFLPNYRKCGSELIATFRVVSNQLARSLVAASDDGD
jgi:hypothetical protein